MCSNMICSLYFSTKDIQTYYFKIVIHRRYDVLFLLHSLMISFLEIDVLTRKQIKNKIDRNKYIKILHIKFYRTVHSICKIKIRSQQNFTSYIVNGLYETSLTLDVLGCNVARKSIFARFLFIDVEMNSIYFHLDSSLYK